MAQSLAADAESAVKMAISRVNVRTVTMGTAAKAATSAVMADIFRRIAPAVKIRVNPAVGLVLVAVTTREYETVFAFLAQRLTTFSFRVSADREPKGAVVHGR